MHLISIALSVATLGASVLAAAGSSFKVRQVGAFHTKDLLLYLGKLSANGVRYKAC